MIEKLISAVFYRELGRVEGYKKHEIAVPEKSVKRAKRLLEKKLDK